MQVLVRDSIFHTKIKRCISIAWNITIHVDSNETKSLKKENWKKMWLSRNP